MLLATACNGDADASIAPADAAPTITPIVITIDPPIVLTIDVSPTPVQIPPPTATPPPTLTPTSPPTPVPSPTPAPSATPLPSPPSPPSPAAAPAAVPATATSAPLPSPTPELEAALGPLVHRDVPMPAVPVSATTGVTSTTLFSLTEVPLPVPLVQLPDSTINIALLGVDTRPQGGGSLSDVIIIASINPDVPAVTMLSIPRDTLVYIPNRRMAKINTAFAAGTDVFKQTIKYNLGLNVDYYASVTFAGVVNAVNTLGGVDITATCTLYQVFPKDPYYLADPVTPLTVTVPYTDLFTGEVWQPGQAVPTQTISIPRPGVYTLNGMQTLAYARTRYGVPGGDIDRGRRAQRVVRALLSKARSNGVMTITKLPALLDQFSRSVKTDLTLDQILALAMQADRFDDGVIRSRYFDGVGLTGATLPEVGSVLIPNRDNIHPYLQQAMNVPLNQQAGSGIPVEVWNGTTQKDFGVVAADRLRELGFNVVSIQDADRVYTRTQVIDFTTTTKGSALPLLQRTFNLKPENIIAEPKEEGPRYRIIAGPDFETCYYKTTPANVRNQVTPTPTPTVEITPDPDAPPTETPLPPPVIVDPNLPPVTQGPPEPTPDPNLLPTLPPPADTPSPTPEG